jgi:hypothetical protein
MTETPRIGDVMQLTTKVRGTGRSLYVFKPGQVVAVVGLPTATQPNCVLVESSLGVQKQVSLMDLKAINLSKGLLLTQQVEDLLETRLRIPGTNWDEGDGENDNYIDAKVREDERLGLEPTSDYDGRELMIEGIEHKDLRKFIIQAGNLDWEMLLLRLRANAFTISRLTRQLREANESVTQKVQAARARAQQFKDERDKLLRLIEKADRYSDLIDGGEQVQYGTYNADGDETFEFYCPPESLPNFHEQVEKLEEQAKTVQELQKTVEILKPQAQSFNMFLDAMKSMKPHIEKPDMHVEALLDAVKKIRSQSEELERLKDATKVDAAFEIVALINALRKDEGDSVTIHSDNADFGGPNSLIYLTNIRGDNVQITGDSVLDCLRKALKHKEDHETSRDPHAG